MITKQEAKKQIEDLVGKFKQLEIAGGIKKLSEADTKRKFIEPLFEILGWDFTNPAEIVMEENIVGERADYGFYLNGRAKFYLEAKAAAADIHREDFAKQAWKYAWNKSIPWAVLTDFKVLKIFNSESTSKKILDHKVLELSLDDYVSEFDYLWLLSKEAFLANALDAFAEKTGKKTGKITVTETLSKDLNKIRQELVEAFKISNPDLKLDLIEEGVQTMIDRLIFIRVAEDRGIEPQTIKPILREWEAKGKQGSIFAHMVSKFRELDEVYNSDLFSRHALEDWDEYHADMKRILQILYGEPDNYEYDFKAIPADVLGAVYENYLCYKLQKTKKDLFGQNMVLGKDLKKRKEQGIYYTPKFIVDYIVKNALGPLLNKCTSVEQLKKIKVLDPACGSGSFLVAAFGEIVKKYQEFNYKPDAYLKMNILKENIYGVDLDGQAVQLARLNLLLNVFDSQFKLQNLDHNIKNGNSLISGSDEELEKNFGKNYRDKKAFNWQEEFPEVFKLGGFDCIIGNPPYIKEFVNKSVFDGLHNSPYYQGKMDIWTMFACISIDLLKDGGNLSFIAPSNWVSNAGASIFRDKVLNDGELKTFIDFGDYKIFEQAGIQTMVFVFEKKKPREKHTLEYLRVKDKDITEDELASVIYREKQKIEIEPQKLIGKNITFSTVELDQVLNKIIQKGNYYLNDNDLTQGIVPNPDVINTRNINKISDNDVRKFNVKINDGVFVIPKKYLNTANPEKEYIKPLFETGQIGRYKFDENNKKEIIYIPRNKQISESSVFIQHLNKYRPIMEERRENLSGSIKYYNLHWPRDSKYFEKGPKIISVRKCQVPTFSYTENECYVMLTFNIIKTDKVNLKYLLGLLNSKLIYFWLKQKGKLQGDIFQIDTEPLQQIPICVEGRNQQKQIITSVDKMLTLNKKLKEITANSNEWQKLKDEIAKTDQKIDQEVYKLYGLTDEEIKIVGGV